MELSKQVVSLELARKLQALGVQKNSYFYWLMQNTGIFSKSRQPELSVTLQAGNILEEGTGGAFVHAYTVAELGEMLPEEYPGDSDSDLMIFPAMSMDIKRWYVRYENDVQETVVRASIAETLADAMAQMLIYLLENNLISLTENK
jgi:hypothetical protein